MKTKLLLYCTKGKPYLFKKWTRDLAFWQEKDIDVEDTLNGKIVAECECEVEEINCVDVGDSDYGSIYAEKEYRTNTLSEKELTLKSCLSGDDIFEYFGEDFDNVGYSLHLSNIKVFDKPNNLESCVYFKNTHEPKMSINRSHYEVLHKAPKNAMRVIFNKEEYILLSASPTEMCNILNGKQTIIVRKKVLKGMM